MKTHKKIAFLALTIATASTAGLAQTVATEPASLPSVPVLADILACRSITEQSARLACFDRTSSALATAQDHEDILVMDKAGMQKTRRSLFGLMLPGIDIFSPQRKRDKAEASTEIKDVDRLEDVVKSATRNGFGQWTITLSDGARWAQVDDQPMNVDPASGMNVVIQRAAMGSYLAKIGGQRAIRMRRVI